MLWLNPEDPYVRGVVVYGRPPTDEDPAPPVDDACIEESLQVAGEVLNRLTNGLIHPAGVAKETYSIGLRVNRLIPRMTPLIEVLGAERLGANCELVPVDITCGFGNEIIPKNLVAPRPGFCGCPTDSHRDLRVTYRFGSTITPGARRSLLEFAHQLYLQCLGDDDCALPDRTASVNREGLSYTILDPQEFLDAGRIGLARVDNWLASVNRARGLGRSAVWTPECPPSRHLATTYVVGAL